MYFPYLKARGEEVEALIATVCKFDEQKVIPIIEPYNDDEDQLYSYQKLEKLCGNLISSRKFFIMRILDDSNLEHLRGKFADFDEFCVRGISIDTYISGFDCEDKRIAVLYDSISVESATDDRNISYHIVLPAVRAMTRFISTIPPDKLVQIDDAFPDQDRNADYPLISTFNSQQCFTYLENGYAGFGDFTTLPANFVAAGGGNQNHITHVIHLSCIINDSIVKVEHFLTTPAEEASIKDRSLATLTKAYSERANFPETNGIKLLIEKYEGGSTSLGTKKRIGIMHHIEIMNNLILT